MEGGAVEGSGRGGLFVHSHGRAEVRGSEVGGSRMAGVHVKWGGQVSTHKSFLFLLGCIQN